MRDDSEEGRSNPYPTSIICISEGKTINYKVNYEKSRGGEGGGCSRDCEISKSRRINLIA